MYEVIKINNINVKNNAIYKGPIRNIILLKGDLKYNSNIKI